MPLDMTGVHSYNPQVHYRRYLSQRHDRIIVVCVQDFDYPDYEPSRFVDLKFFDNEDLARLTPLDPDDVHEQMRLLDPDDTLGVLQGKRLLHELGRTSYPGP